ncbi:hypothetical protein KC217_22695, partial [Mycobacterium tuberculosis]|nr:hypothetical protein [Mycobacterium tuberculosis]
TEVRVFKGRDSMGVRGIALGDGDRVISMTVIRHFDATADERVLYLKQSRLVRGEVESDAIVDEEAAGTGQLPPDRYNEMSAYE